ncbi:hypothetical protein M436DRAFT_23180, partial [Aureobasidium namibiae CBS 147.97]
RIVQTTLYLLCLCAAGAIVGIYGYFLSYLTQHKLPISASSKAIEGISSAAVLYTLINAISTCFLGGHPVLAIISFILDTCFAGGFIAIAVLTRRSVSSCSGYLHTPLGSGVSYSTPPSRQDRAGRVPYLWFVCSLDKAGFAVSIVGIVILVTTAIMQLLRFR